MTGLTWFERFVLAAAMWDAMEHECDPAPDQIEAEPDIPAPVLPRLRALRPDLFGNSTL